MQNQIAYTHNMGRERDNGLLNTFFTESLAGRIGRILGVGEKEAESCYYVNFNLTFTLWRSRCMLIAEIETWFDPPDCDIHTRWISVIERSYITSTFLRLRLQR